MDSATVTQIFGSLLLGNFGSFFARFRKADSNRLFAAFGFPAFAAFLRPFLRFVNRFFHFAFGFRTVLGHEIVPDDGGNRGIPWIAKGDRCTYGVNTTLTHPSFLSRKVL